MFDDVAGLPHEALAVVAGNSEHRHGAAPPPRHQHRARFWISTDVDQLKLDAERVSTPANVDAVRAVFGVVEGHAVVSFARWMHQLGESYPEPFFFFGANRSDAPKNPVGYRDAS